MQHGLPAGRWLFDCALLAAGHAGERARRMPARRKYDTAGRGVMGKGPLFKANKVGFL